MRELAIWMEGVRVGQLVGHDRGDLAVIYDDDYAADTNSFMSRAPTKPAT